MKAQNIELSRSAASEKQQQFIQTQPVLPVGIIGDGSNDLLSRSLCFLQYALRFLQLFQVLTLEDIGGAMVV